MRSATARAGRGKGALVDDEIDGRRGAYLFRMLGWSPRDVVGFLVGGFAAIAILINMLFMQSGSHPAPMFKNAPAAVKPAAMTDSIPAAVPRPRPVELAPAPRSVEPAPTKLVAPPAPPASRMPGEIINDIQRELARRGYYDGAVDGLYGPRTDAAIRDFEQAAALKPSTEPNEALLQAIVRAPAKLAKVATGTTPVLRPPAPVRSDAVAEKPAPSKRVIALQRALADYGYGQFKPSGIVDAETQAAIEKFERERKLPVTGQPSDRVARELSSMTGRPLD